jgi:hypothetical protein
LSLLCELDVLFLRPDRPGDVLRSGDIDNRMKTIFDALRVPSQESELGGYLVPADDETPFFCLLEDDNLITRITVEADRLWEPTAPEAGVNDARLVIKVGIRPYVVDPSNIMF